MDLYRAYDVKIREIDRNKVDEILWRHYGKGDLDEVTIDVITNKDSDGEDVITYRIKPYISDDFETIMKEFKEAGIQII